MKNILVGVDFDEKTEVLIEKAQEIAKRFNAKLWLLHVVSPLPEYVGFDATPHYVRDDREEELERMKKRLDDYATTIVDKGVETEGIIMEGPTTDVILTESKELGVDLIVCGHHDHNLMYKMLFGSVSAAVVQKSRIPVLVFPLG
jgi:nucleotide-binding universal stress UspA family protein